MTRKALPDELSEELSDVELNNLHGADYAERFESRKNLDRLQNLLGHVVLPPACVVGDFGCGSAMVLEFLDRSRVKQYFGIDLSAPLLAKAEQRKQRLGFNQAELLQQSVQDFCALRPGTLDMALCLDFSEHVYDQELLSILRAIHASLKPGGVLYLHTPNAEFFVEIMKDRGFILKQFPEHVAVRNSRQQSLLLQQSGFTNVEVGYLPHYNILRLLHPLSRVPWLGRFFKARMFITATK